MLQTIKVCTSELQPGMYVSSLDRPWLEVPFPLQGFRINSAAEVTLVQRYCEYVFIDTYRSDTPAGQNRFKAIDRPRKALQEIFNGHSIKVYQDSGSWADEIPRARIAIEALTKTVDSIFHQVSSAGTLEIAAVKQSVEPMIDSICRNPDACIWLVRMKQQDAYNYRHAVGASIWAVALGRQIGLPKSDLRSLALGGLLFDIGKSNVNQELLGANRTLTDDELAEVRLHVDAGIELIRDSGLMNKDVLDMVAFHHERHDGSGYPGGRSGDRIPVFARIAAIVDCYDAITSHRNYARAIPPSEAIKKLYEWRDIEFQSELVEAFIQAVGIYPAGTLVELSSGEIAVVVAEYRTRRLRPRVMVLLDADKQAVSNMKLIDLVPGASNSEGGAVEIRSSLEPGAYGIDMSAIRL